MAKTNWVMDDTVMPDDLNQIGQEINTLQSDGSVTDAKIGDRTISDATAPTSNVGKLTGLLGWLAYMIKAITGKANWHTAPAITLEATKTHVDDNVKHITAAERTNWNSKAPTTEVTTSAAGLMSSNDKLKLDGVALGANNYVHPSNHPASVITQDANNRFVTDAEKANWNAKETTTGAQTKANIAQSAAISAAATDATNKANAVQANLTAHDNNTIKHITAGERTAWNGKPNADGTVQVNLNAEMVDGYLFDQDLRKEADVRFKSVSAEDAIGAQFFVSNTLDLMPLMVYSQVRVTNLNVDMVDGFHATSNNTASSIAVRDANSAVIAQRFISQVTTGTSPLQVNSTTMVNNLNSERTNGIKTFNSLTTPVGASNGDLWFPPPS